MRQLASNLISKGVKPENILMINKEFESFSFVETYKDLDMLISAYEKKYCPQGRIYIFIDEIQEIEGWEKVVNSYSQDYSKDYEVFISGSNSKMLSSELSTLLSGRYVEFKIFPFSYSEYCEIHNVIGSKQTCLEYMQTGGLPELINLNGDETKRNYVSTLKDKDKEVDFVAFKDDDVLYVQSTYMLIDEQTITREYSALKSINDNYRKIVVSLDDIKMPSQEGIEHIQAWNFIF